MKATFPDGTVFDGTPEEFLIIRNQSPMAANGHKAMTKAANGTSVWTEKRARAFWDSLDPLNGGGKQKKILLFLIENGGRATEKEVWKHLDIEKGQELAGVLANITRNARREAHDDEIRAVQWAYSDKHDAYYFIPNDLLSFLKQFS